MCGRRWGKSELAALIMAATACLFRKQLLWIVGETFETSDATLDLAVKHLRAFLDGAMLARYSRADHVIELHNGSRIYSKSADHEAGLLGRGLNGAVLEEAAQLAERVWTQNVRPALADKRGWMAAITSPRGRGNWTYREKVATVDAGDPEWSFAKSASWTNTIKFPGGRQDPEIVGLHDYYQRIGMGPLFDQEYGASFAHLAGRVFQMWDPERHVAPMERCLRGVQEFRLILDWGHRNPAAILVAGRTSDGGLRFVGEWYHAGRTPADQIAAACELRDRWHTVGGWADPSEPGLIEQANQAKLFLSPAHNDHTDKRMALAELLAAEDGLLVADGECPNFCSEIEDYHYPERGHAASEEPVKERDHLMDCGQYAAASWARLDGSGTRGTRLVFGEPPRERVTRAGGLIRVL